MRDILAIVGVLAVITLGLLKLGYLTPEDIRHAAHTLALYAATLTEG